MNSRWNREKNPIKKGGTWRNNGGTMEEQWKDKEGHGGTMEEQWKDMEGHGGTMEGHGGTMEGQGGTWRNNGRTRRDMEEQWKDKEGHGGTMEEQWKDKERHGGTMEEQWKDKEGHGGTMEEQWKDKEGHGGRRWNMEEGGGTWRNNGDAMPLLNFPPSCPNFLNPQNLCLSKLRTRECQEVKHQSLSHVLLKPCL